MTPSIGIKIANGEFYPVLEEGSTVKKRLILTTVHDGQSSVQIDLYRSESATMADALYIGSLVVENIQDKPKGEPSIELVIGTDGSDQLVAEAVDLDPQPTGERQQLSVLLRSDEEIASDADPDFELGNDDQPPQDLYAQDEADDDSDGKKKIPIVPVVVGVCAVLLIGAVLAWFFVLNKPETEKQAVQNLAPPTKMETAPVKSEKPADPPPVVAEPPKPVVQAQPAAPAPAPKKEPAPAPAKRVRPDAPVKSYKVPKTIPAQGFVYKVRWGDTLWDISEAFYRNPWLYPRIARFNKIRNPDLIISGSKIKIPPKK